MTRQRTLGPYLLLLVSLLGLATCAARKPPETPQAQLEFGVEMARRGLWSEALFRFRQAERANPSDPRILNNLAVAYEALGRFEDALEQYQKAIKADRGNRELRRNYSRFIEFYRAFKPDQTGAGTQDGEGAPPAESEDAVASNQPSGE